MGKPRAFRLLRSCLFFSGHKRDKEEAEAMDEDVKLGPGGGDDDHPNDVDGDVSTSSAVSSSSSQEQEQEQLLPEDIILDVLARLPVKTLCRFRCVCKAWRALISSPAFASAQASRAAAPLVAGVFGTPPRPLDRFCPARAPRFLPEPSLEVRVMDPADGGSVVRVVKDVKSARLMCGARLGRLVMVDQGERGARVMDPATGRVMVVLGNGGSSSSSTALLYSDAGRRTAAAACACDDNDGGDGDIDNNNTVYACRLLCYNSLGRASPSGAYKVVHLRDGIARNGDPVQICHVATVAWPWEWDDAGGGGTGIVMEEPNPSACWRQRPEPPILTCCCSDCTAVVHGVLHLMNHRYQDHSGRPWTMRSQLCIASFDLESEEWKPTIISGPPINDKDLGWDTALAALEGSLCLVQTARHDDDDNNLSGTGSRRRCYTKNIWFLVDSERSIWVKKYAIQMTQGWCLFKPLEITVDGRILMLNAFRKKEQDLYDAQCVLQLYHPSTGALTDLMEMGNDFRGPLMLYTGSLFS